MIEGVTKSGFRFQLADDALNDYELLEALREADTKDASAIIDAVNILLSEEQKKELKDHIRNEHGRVGAVEMIQEVAEILQATQEGKNS